MTNRRIDREELVIEKAGNDLALLVGSICLAVVSAIVPYRLSIGLHWTIGSSNEDDSSAAILASVRMLKQFEKDGIKWEKLAKEIAQK